MININFNSPIDFHKSVALSKPKNIQIHIILEQAYDQGAITDKRKSFLNASENGFKVGAYDEMIPNADLVVNNIVSPNELIDTDSPL